jgi:pseudouridine synthase
VSNREPSRTAFATPSGIEIRYDSRKVHAPRLIEKAVVGVGGQVPEGGGERLRVAGWYEQRGVAQGLPLGRGVRGDDGATGGGSLVHLGGYHVLGLDRRAEDAERDVVPGHQGGRAPPGRLDLDSTGLFVFTKDGRVAKRLIGQDSEVEKESLVRVEGTLTEEGMKLLHHGLELDDVKLKPARVSWANENQLRFVLREGRKRQIRRMCEKVGLVVTALKRVRTGGVPLGPLPVGQWRYLRKDEKF